MENTLSRFSFFLRKKDINVKVSEFHIHQNNIETEWHAKEWISDQCPGVMVGRVENRLCIRCLEKTNKHAIYFYFIAVVIFCVYHTGTHNGFLHLIFIILKSSKILRIQLSNLQLSMDWCWRNRWASRRQMSTRCSEPMKSYPQRDSVHRSLTEGPARKQKKHKSERTWRVRCPTESNSATADAQPTRRRRRWRNVRSRMKL